MITIAINMITMMVTMMMMLMTMMLMTLLIATMMILLTRRLDVMNLQEQLDLKLQQRQARETGICQVDFSHPTF